jgi:hypothetical protein
MDPTSVPSTGPDGSSTEPAPTPTKPRVAPPPPAPAPVACEPDEPVGSTSPKGRGSKLALTLVLIIAVAACALVAFFLVHAHHDHTASTASATLAQHARDGSADASVASDAPVNWLETAGGVSETDAVTSTAGSSTPNQRCNPDCNPARPTTCP